MENIYENIVGSGVLFPIVLTKNEHNQYGWYPVKGDVKLIENNLEALFIHQIGTKFREEDFGTRLWECLEESNTQAQAFLVNEFMKEAFDEWEERIIYKGTQVQRAGSRLELIFTYQLNGSSSSKTGTLTYDASNNTLNT